VHLDRNHDDTVLAFAGWKKQNCQFLKALEFAGEPFRSLPAKGLSELTKLATILCNYLMPDEQPPPPPASDSPQTTGLPSNIAAAIACVPLIGGLVFYFLEKRDQFVRFYAMQSIILGGIYLLCWIVYSIIFGILSSIPAIGFFFGILLSVTWALIRVAVLVLFIITVFKAFTNKRWEIPYIGAMARKQVGEG
jgi:uncharacterized membrane protein